MQILKDLKCLLVGQVMISLKIDQIYGKSNQ